MKSLRLLAVAATAAALPTFAQDLEKVTQPGMVTGTVNIAFNTRMKLDDKGKPQIGSKDVYETALSVGKTTEFKGKVERLPRITSDVLGREQQAGKLYYSLDLAVINPVNMTQRKVVGKWVGDVPIDANGVYALDGSNDSAHRIAVEAIGKAPSFTDKFSGRLVGKGSKKDNAVMSYIRKVAGKEIKLEVKGVDPMRFENVNLAMGPSQNYPKCSVNGNLDFDYETGNWLTNGIRFTYSLNGKQYEDTVTGSIKWVEDANRASNGKGQYEFNLRWNEGAVKPASTEADAFKGASDEEAFFAVDDSIPSLTGIVKYEDTLIGSGEEAIPSHSKITYDLAANQLTKQQVMNFVKLWLIGIGPTNDE